MEIKDYVRINQPIVFNSFRNALKNNHLSHAYLLSGDQSSPLLDIATYLAKSIVCDEPSPLACDKCITCMRIDEGNFADLIVVDGSKGLIKKDDIQNIIDTFAKTAVEAKGKMIYIINLVENMNKQAVNSLLKFLEEPENQIYAILTTENEMKVLPTIISRTQKLILRPIDRQKILQECEKENINMEDAELLSFFYNDCNLIKKYIDNEEYLNAKDYATQTMIELSKGINNGIYYIQHSVIPNIKGKEATRFYLDIISVFIEEIKYKQTGTNITLKSYDKIIEVLATLFVNTQEILIEVMVTRGRIDLNLISSTLLDHIAYIFKKGGEK